MRSRHVPLGFKLRSYSDANYFGVFPPACEALNRRQQQSVKKPSAGSCREQQKQAASLSLRRFGSPVSEPRNPRKRTFPPGDGSLDAFFRRDLIVRMRFSASLTRFRDVKTRTARQEQKRGKHRQVSDHPRPTLLFRVCHRDG